jgi:U3 small nucleolar RNA-associated protein 6
MDMQHDNSIRRRIFYLYDRACRKFKMNKIIWKEYLHVLVKCKSIQKLNVVVSKAVQIHPDELQFWLVGIYCELDMKGNLFSSRNLML